MSQDPRRWISYKALTELAGTDASERDRDGLFPERAFVGLRQLGLVGKPPLKSVEVGRLLRVLAAIGRGNLSVDAAQLPVLAHLRLRSQLGCIAIPIFEERYPQFDVVALRKVYQ